MAEWSRIANTTISEYVKGEEVNVIRNRKLLDLLRSRGRIEMNHGGSSFVKRVRYKRAPMVGYADGDTITFTRRDKWKTAELDWRGYSVNDAMTKKERLMNKGAEAIVDIFANLAKTLMEDIEDQFGDECYVDGNATGNSKRCHGIESFMGTSGVLTNGYVGNPSDTYANLRTDLAYYGGNWSQSASNTEWPTGTGDAHYDFFTPTIVSYTNASFSASSDTWANNNTEALRYGIIKSRKNKSKKGMLDLAVLNDELYRLFLGTWDARQQLNVNRGQAGGKYSVGFEDSTNFDGVEVTYEYGIPSGVGYGFNADQMMLMSLQPTLFGSHGPEYKSDTKSWVVEIDFFGNFWFNPRYFVKWAALG